MSYKVKVSFKSGKHIQPYKRLQDGTGIKAVPENAGFGYRYLSLFFISNFGDNVICVPYKSINKFVLKFFVLAYV